MTNQSKVNLKAEELKLISEFEKELEYLFLTETKVVICPTQKSFIKLTIEVDFNFSIDEIVSLAKTALIKNRDAEHIQNLVLLFEKSIKKLNKSLTTYIDIEEISMYFKNTSITINSIEYNSIVEELDRILIAILYHYEFYSTLMGATPNEIHIPVLEDVKTKNILNSNGAITLPNYTSPYSQYWGLYFDLLDKPIIYNLDRTNIIPGDLDLSLE